MNKTAQWHYINEGYVILHLWEWNVQSHWVLAETMLLRAIGPYEYGWQLLEKKNLHMTLVKTGFLSSRCYGWARRKISRVSECRVSPLKIHSSPESFLTFVCKTTFASPLLFLIIHSLNFLQMSSLRISF